MKSVITWILLLAFGCFSQPPEQEREVVKQQTDVSLPDLIVAGAVLINAEMGEFKVIVKNIGKGQAASCQLRLTIMDQHGKQLLKTTYAEQSAIGPNETDALIISAQMSLPTLKYILETDATNKVREANERNNVHEGEIGRY